ncbi:MAG: glycosyltransferase [Phycisphaerae bacterium]|nr:glycosyltransferase [Phycisphaerae bacterium]
MRIALVNNFYYERGGSERVLLKEEELLRQHGHQTIAFSTQHQGNCPSEAAGFFVDRCDTSHLSFVQKLRTVPKMVYNRSTGKAFLKLIDDRRPDLVHCHNIYGTLTTAVLDAARRRKVPTVLTLHDCKLICPSYLMLDHGRVCEACLGGTFYRCVLKGCHKNSRTASLVYTIESYFNRWLGKYDWPRYLLCPSMFLLRKHLEAGFAEDRLVHLPNPIDTQQYAPDYGRHEFGVFIGRLSHEKGIFTLLRAVRGLSIPLRIVGDGPLKEPLQQFITDNGVNGVALDGYKTGEELRELCRRAAMVIVPSECHENAPMTILEAFASGKPVIAANIGGISEMVIPGKTGLLFQSGDADQLRDCIRSLWSDPAKLVEMGRAARRLVETSHSLETHYERLIAVYNQTIR